MKSMKKAKIYDVGYASPTPLGSTMLNLDIIHRYGIILIQRKFMEWWMDKHFFKHHCL